MDSRLARSHDCTGRSARTPAAPSAARPRQADGLPRSALLAALLLTFGATLPLAGQGWIDPVRPGMGSVERVESRVQVTVDNGVATVEVDEWFLNSGDRVAEGHYLYPLPADAALSGTSLYQGETELRGEVMDADEARAIYEEIVRRRADPALIEYLGDGLFRARVFPIEPGERRRVTLRYMQILEPAGESLHFRTPGALRPTMPVRAEPGPDDPRDTQPRIGANAPVHLTMTVSPASPWLDPFSPSHALDVDRRGEELRIEVAEAEGRVSVFLPRSGDLVGLSVLPHRPAGEDGFVLLSLTPPAPGNELPEPRDVVVVVDVSGSMAGRKIEQARTAVRGLLEGLDADDRFRLVSFSNAVHQLDTDWRPARGAALDEATRWVGDLRADGGTNIDGALDAAFGVDPGRDRLPVVVFLTDGLPTVGERDPDRITAEAEGRRGLYRVFAFGVGHDVNTRLLDRLSEATRGTTQYVEPGEDVERALSLLATRISHPVFTDLRIVESPVAISEWYPVHIPDLFAGETLTLLARYRGEGGGRVVIEGRRGGELRTVATEAVFPRVQRANAGLPRLWAARKVGHLTRQLWTEGETPELVEEIRTTALRYGLPSPFTSILVQEPGALAADGSPLAPVPLTFGESANGARPLDRIVVPGGAAGSARRSTGAQAVQVAEESRRFRDAARIDELEALMERAAPKASDQRVVAGRVLRLQDGVWTDAGLDPDAPTLRVQRFGEAWFELVRLLPELESALRLERIALAGVGLTLEVDADGLESLDTHTRSEITRAFRTTGG